MFVAEKVLLLLVISLTAKPKSHEIHIAVIFCSVVKSLWIISQSMAVLCSGQIAEKWLTNDMDVVGKRYFVVFVFNINSSPLVPHICDD